MRSNPAMNSPSPSLDEATATTDEIGSLSSPNSPSNQPFIGRARTPFLDIPNERGEFVVHDDENDRLYRIIWKRSSGRIANTFSRRPLKLIWHHSLNRSSKIPHTITQTKSLISMLMVILVISITAGVIVKSRYIGQEFCTNAQQMAKGIGSSPEGCAPVQPLHCHSHNDYLRQVPLFEALQYGCIGVEADVWSYKEELYVGHSHSSLTAGRTLKTLYLNPLLEILSQKSLVINSSSLDQGFHGVFDKPNQTLILLIDFKSSGSSVWPQLQKELQPLREKDYLTYWNSTHVVERPITIVASGNAPFEFVVTNTTYRDIFFDAPLRYLGYLNGTDGHVAFDKGNIGGLEYEMTKEKQHNLNPNVPIHLPGYSIQNSYYASLDLEAAIGSIRRLPLTTQLDRIRFYIKAAHKIGLKVRFWGLPSQPTFLQEYLWLTFLQEGVDILNVDDLKSASSLLTLANYSYQK